VTKQHVNTELTSDEDEGPIIFQSASELRARYTDRISRAITTELFRTDPRSQTFAHRPRSVALLHARASNASVNALSRL